MRTKGGKPFLVEGGGGYAQSRAPAAASLARADHVEGSHIEGGGSVSFVDLVIAYN